MSQLNHSEHAEDSNSTITAEAGLSNASLKPENAAIFDSSDDECQQGPGTALHWFRRGLRFHDNPALCESIKLSHDFRCIYIIDPSTINTSSRVETNKWRFLLESLQDLDCTLRKHNSRLYVLQGQPTYVLPSLFKHWHVNVLSIEEDPTPYGSKRDEAIGSLAHEYGVYVVKRSSHTLHPISKLVDLCGAKTPATLKQFAVIFQAAGLPDITTETVPFSRLKLPTSHSDYDPKYCVPSFEELGLPEPSSNEGFVWHGGESEALKRLSYHLERRAWVACFEKRPSMTSASLLASPSGLGPYLNFGCLSPRLLYWKLDELYRQINGSDVPPPLSLHGQLLLSEFYYLSANLNKKFDQVAGNKLCLQIPWKKTDLKVMQRFAKGDTGFPWIDAIIKQLVKEGWIHGMAKHALISFITHGQLFFSWEEAAKLLDTYCLEGDICTNNGVAMLLSGSSLVKHLPSNVDSPVLSGRQVDPGADFIRRYLPPLKSFPAQYIYEPWTAPLDIQQQAGCVIGHDYPAPMLDHYQALHSNMLSLQQFVQSLKDRVSAKKRHHVRLNSHD